MEVQLRPLTQLRLHAPIRFSSGIVLTNTSEIMQHRYSFSFLSVGGINSNDSPAGILGGVQKPNKFEQRDRSILLETYEEVGGELLNLCCLEFTFVFYVTS